MEILIGDVKWVSCMLNLYGVLLRIFLGILKGDFEGILNNPLTKSPFKNLMENTYTKRLQIPFKIPHFKSSFKIPNYNTH